ncbi:VWA domain-containing protein [Amycolatopsis thermoflava]|uniref:VWA domain-containing protein n=1 Tax=Amycolatopsis thermoflava TaxID=84480 RepID=UPI000408BD99|nr:VWA domain-containing protein [Amycolatopsis thermoflava]
MSTHVATATATPTAVFPAAPGWLTLSAAFGDEVPVIADRDDIVVTVAPGAGHGAPACFFYDPATIEVDGVHVDDGVDPATVAPHRVGDRKRYRTAWGLLTHECAHAKHSVWRAPDDAPPGAAAAAELLEESRIEAAQVRRRPGDRYWLRASATNLLLADLKVDLDDPATAPQMTTADAARCAALLLARVDGGVLNSRETATVRREITRILDAGTLDTLREIWREAHRTADDDTDTMIDLGRRWCEALGTDQNEPPPEPGNTAPAQGGTSGTPSPLATALADAVAAIDHAVAAEPAPTDPTTEALEAAAREDAAHHQAQRDARAVFDGPGAPPTSGTTIRGTRPPTASERTAARHLARALTTAGARDRTPTKTRSALPPGRLRMRGAMTADAQRAAGAIPTAEPFTRTTRATVPAPPLRIGIACDVSGSMSAFARPVASAAWILAEAARHTSVPATTATVIFGYHVRPITRPGSTAPRVTEFDTNDGEHHVDTAISALDGALDLTRPDAARLLVIVSDGCFEETTKEPGQKMLDRLRASGCALLWLAPDAPFNEPMRGATVHTLTDPTTTARAIGQAATAALRATR